MLTTSLGPKPNSPKERACSSVMAAIVSSTVREKKTTQAETVNLRGEVNDVVMVK